MSDSITNSVIKRLYGLSAGRCNICKASVFEGEVHIGEMAHVIAKNSGGPRGDVNNTNNNSYDNLILLCANHHIEVDKRPSYYTVDKLKSIKRDHEVFIEKATDLSPYAFDKRLSDVIF